MPVAMMATLVTISGQDGQLWRNGILFVRMTWMISVCVSRLSTNQPVWNRLWLCAAASGARRPSTRRRRA